MKFFELFFESTYLLRYVGMNMLCSDKTGTLTMNKMVIQDETPVYVEGKYI